MLEFGPSFEHHSTPVDKATHSEETDLSQPHVFVAWKRRVQPHHPVWCEKAAEARSVLVESPK